MRVNFPTRVECTMDDDIRPLAFKIFPLGISYLTVPGGAAKGLVDMSPQTAEGPAGEKFHVDFAM